ncbi:unnamed protein product [Lasius platythorax]|uniref:Uncharacterized protein n=1 Tax=Lasius platythorax TaxID=488582 RepID=A0AAV2NLX3_9HYME
MEPRPRHRERESREEIAERGGGINKVEETGVRHVGGYMGGNGFLQGVRPSRPGPFFAQGLPSPGTRRCSLPHAYPRLVETKSFDRSAVCHGAKNGNHTHE